MLRNRILLGVAPLFALLLVTGIYAVVLFSKLGGAIDVILRENYQSVVFSQNMREAVERMDSGMLFMLGGDEERGAALYKQNLPIFEDNLQRELNNITLPGEGDLANKLSKLYQEYVARTRVFLATRDLNERKQMYFNEMLPLFSEIKDTAGEILRINQENMVHADREARLLSARSIKYMVAAVTAGFAIALYLVFHLQTSVLKPIKDLTAFTRDLGEGQLDQVVPIVSRDELGELAEAFNKMSSKLRAYRQTTTGEIIKARQMTELTFSAFPDAIVALSPEGNPEFKNPSAEHLFRKVTINDQLPARIRRLADPILKGGEDYLPTSFEKAFCVRANDKETFLLPRIIGMRGDSGDIFGAVVVLQDVTRFRLLDEVKTNLVSTVSHELKTPLTSVRMGLHLLLEERIGPLNSKQIELLLAARDDSERLLRMINDLLDLARLEAGASPMMLASASPAELIRGAISELQASLEPHGVRLVSDIKPDLPDVCVEKGQISHVFSNLISNAAKNSPPGEEIIVRAASDEGGAVRFSVIDKGKGIPEQFQARIFEKFYRVPGAEKGGAGLGLAIAREIVVAHGGNIGLKSKPEEGAEFYFVLPATTNMSKL